jgi:hypothetical protein
MRLTLQELAFGDEAPTDRALASAIAMRRGRCHNMASRVRQAMAAMARRPAVRGCSGVRQRPPGRRLRGRAGVRGGDERAARATAQMAA